MSTTAFNILFESASGYSIFSVLENEEIAGLLEETPVKWPRLPPSPRELQPASPHVRPPRNPMTPVAPNPLL